MENIKHKVLTLLGFAQKAGKIISGSNTVDGLYGKSHIKLIIVAEDCSPAVLKQIKYKCESIDQTYVVFGTKDELGQAIGKSARNVLAIKDENFSSAIIGYIKTTEQL